MVELTDEDLEKLSPRENAALGLLAKRMQQSVNSRSHLIYFGHHPDRPEWFDDAQSALKKLKLPHFRREDVIYHPEDSEHGAWIALPESSIPKFNVLFDALASIAPGMTRETTK